MWPVCAFDELVVSVANNARFLLDQFHLPIQHESQFRKVDVFDASLIPLHSKYFFCSLKSYLIILKRINDF